MEDVYLKFKIGVFYKDYDWMERIFARIIRDIGRNQSWEMKNIDFSLRTYPYYIKIGDLVTIYFVKPDDCIGYRFDRIYGQKDFNEEEIAIMKASRSFNYPESLD